MTDVKKGFAARWSKRKDEARRQNEPELEAGDETEKVAHLPDEKQAAEQQQVAAGKEADKDTTETEGELLSEADFDDVDFEALDKSSDYTRFIQANVPEEIQKKALRKLWASDEVFEVLDGMNDYDEDFTGDGLAGKAFKTAYKVGRGFITEDDEKPGDDVADTDVDVVETAGSGESQDLLKSNQTDNVAESTVDAASEITLEKTVEKQPDQV